MRDGRFTEPAAVIAGLPADHRPAPRVDIYDELLAKRSTGRTDGLPTSKEDAS